jgi:hypothetical protein
MNKDFSAIENLPTGAEVGDNGGRPSQNGGGNAHREEIESSTPEDEDDGDAPEDEDEDDGSASESENGE